MSDSFSETSSTGWFSRIRESIKGIVIGLILFVVSFPVLWFNEGNSAETVAGLKQLAMEAVTVESNSVNPAFEGKPVHMIGRAETEELIRDGRFGVTANAIKLIREVTMYQWKENQETEKQKKLGGGEEKITTYSYEQVWSAEPINSSEFNDKGRAEHENPPMPYRSETTQAKDVSLGAFKLSPFLVVQMNDQDPFALDAEQRGKLPADMRTTVKDDGPGYYKGDSGNPQIGDIRINFQVVKPDTVSIIAAQIGSTFEKYLAKNGKSFGLLEMGERNKESVVQVARDKNTTRTWMVRFGGWLAMFVGLTMLFKPLSVLGDVVPIVGDIVGVGTGILSAIISAALSLMTIAVAWIVYRPLIGIPLAVVAVGFIVFAVMKIGKQRKLRAAD